MAIPASNAGYQDIFLTKLNAGGGLVWSTYLGGAGDDLGLGLSLDGGGDVYVTGTTLSLAFPLLSATQSSRAGGQDAFVAAFSASGQLFFSTYLGGNGTDAGQALLFDGANHLNVAGMTASTNFPITSTVTTTPVVQATPAGGDDAFLTQYGSLGIPTAPVSNTEHLRYSYDGAGRRTGLTYADGKTASWNYDGAGRVSAMTQPGTGSWTVTANGVGNLTSATAPNGGQQTWGYDAGGRLVSTRWYSGSTQIFTDSVTLNAAGQPTVVADSWGTTDYGYDSAGRLHTVKYPTTLGSTITETDGYDADGNRLTISDTGGVSGTVLVTNTYDLADELTTSLNKVGSSQPLTTTYTYDGNGNQIIASGPTSATVSTYNLQNQLIQVQGPTTDLQLVYDGQGDRLRSYEQLVPTPVIVNEVQDLVGAPGNRVNTGAQPLPDGLSDLASDGTQDYLYLQPGSGMAPAMGYNGSHATYLAIDTLGSVRLATDPTNAVIGEAAYDAWGNIQASNGSTLLHGLQGSSPFGYAGQYYDPGPGTYAMRARTYNPATGQFTSEDPQAYDPQVPLTLNPYEYAGDVPDLINDPSGMGWLPPTSASNDELYEYYIANALINPSTSNPPSHAPGLSEYDVPVVGLTCNHQRTGQMFSANLVMATGTSPLLSGQVWDMEHVQTFKGREGVIAQGIFSHLILNAQRGGLEWSSTGCSQQYFHICENLPPREAVLQPGGDFFQAYGIAATEGGQAVGGKPALVIPTQGYGTVVAWYGGPGLILYDVLPQGEDQGCGFDPKCIGDFLVLDNVHTVFADPNLVHKGIAFVGLAATFADLSGVVKGLRGLGRGETPPGEGLAADPVTLGQLGKNNIARIMDDVEGGQEGEAAFQQAIKQAAEGCSFPGDTGVATLYGLVSIAKLHVGDSVLAEDLATGKVEPEKIEAVIAEAVKPLMQIQLSDGSTLSVTTNHPFWGESGPGIAKPGWVEAGNLRVGDKLGTEDGRGVTITGLRYNVGYAHVYTLTVTSDHDFFVGTAEVLVHNCTFLGKLRPLPDSQGFGYKYQRFITGKNFEYDYKLDNGKLVFLDDLNVPAGYIIDTKWTGLNDFAWAHSPLNPNFAHYDVSKPLTQMTNQLELARELHINGVRWIVSNNAAEVYYRQLFSSAFPDQFSRGVIRVDVISISSSLYSRWNRGLG